MAMFNNVSDQKYKRTCLQLFIFYKLYSGLLFSIQYHLPGYLSRMFICDDVNSLRINL